MTLQTLADMFVIFICLSGPLMLVYCTFFWNDKEKKDSKEDFRHFTK